MTDYGQKKKVDHGGISINWGLQGYTLLLFFCLFSSFFAQNKEYGGGTVYVRKLGPLDF